MCRFTHGIIMWDRLNFVFFKLQKLNLIAKLHKYAKYDFGMILNNF